MSLEEQGRESTAEPLSEDIDNGNSSDEEPGPMSKYIDIMCDRDAGFTTDEKIDFADLIINSFLKQSSNVNCYECKRFYQPHVMPFLLKCGHSLCRKCYDRSKSKFCSSCSQNMNVRLPLPNLDLLTFAMSVQNAITVVCRAREAPGLKPVIPRESLILSGMASLFDKAKLRICMAQNLHKVIEKRLCSIYKAFDKISKAAADASRIRELVPDLTKLGNLYKRLRLLLNFSETMKDTSEFLEESLLLCLEDTAIREQDFYQLLTEEVHFTTGSVKSLRDSGYDCWAVARVRGKYIYSELRIGTGVVANAFQGFPHDANHDNMYIIDYEALRTDCFASGVFLELHFDKDQTQWKRMLYLNIDDNSLFAHQLYILCSGEKGACYKGGRGFVNSERIIFESYADGENQRSDDYILGVPDVFGELIVPDVAEESVVLDEVEESVTSEEVGKSVVTDEVGKSVVSDEVGEPVVSDKVEEPVISDEVKETVVSEVEMVCTDRLFGKEAQFYVAKKNSKNEKQRIGKLKWGKIDLLPEGKFTISNCGIMFNPITPKEPSEPPQEPEKPAPNKSEESPKEPN